MAFVLAYSRLVHLYGFVAEIGFSRGSAVKRCFRRAGGVGHSRFPDEVDSRATRTQEYAIRVASLHVSDDPGHSFPHPLRAVSEINTSGSFSALASGVSASPKNSRM